MANFIMVAAPALLLATVGCGSQAQYDANQLSMNAQLAVANAATPQDAVAAPPEDRLFDPTANQMVQPMGAAATDPPPQ